MLVRSRTVRRGNLRGGGEHGADLSGYSAATPRCREVPPARLRKGFRLFAESLLERRSRGRAREEEDRDIGALKQQKDQLTQATILLFLEAHYGDHPYGRIPRHGELGPRDDPADLKTYYERWADPRTCDRDLRDIDAGRRSRVRKASGDAAAARYAALGRCRPSHDAVTRVEERRDKQQAHFVIGYRGAFTDPDRYALDVLGSALAGWGPVFVN